MNKKDQEAIEAIRLHQSKREYYEILQVYRNPITTINIGEAHTKREWLKIFPSISTDRFDLMTDWFRKVKKAYPVVVSVYYGGYRDRVDDFIVRIDNGSSIVISKERLAQIIIAESKNLLCIVDSGNEFGERGFSCNLNKVDNSTNETHNRLSVEIKRNELDLINEVRCNQRMAPEEKWLILNRIELLSNSIKILLKQ